MFLLPLIVSTFGLACHAAIFPEVLFPAMLESGNYPRYEYYTKMQQMEEMLRQYRTYLINAIYENNNDICSLFDYITDNSGANAINNNHNDDTWAAAATHELIDNDSNNRNKGLETNPSRKKRSSSEDSRHPTAIDTYFEVANTISDRRFYVELLKKLQHVCTMNENTVNFKRDGTKVIGKKQKFHSWGGKRDNGRGKDPLKDQVIPRSYPPFHSWGG